MPIFHAGDYSLDLEADEAIRKAKFDADCAARVLVIAADYLRRREPLPDNLAKYLADAIDYSMDKPKKDRANTLALKLNLIAKNRRPKDWYEIGEFVENLLSDSNSMETGSHSSASQKTKPVRETVETALEKASEKFKVSVSTAKRNLRKYREAHEENERINREEGH